MFRANNKICRYRLGVLLGVLLAAAGGVARAADAGPQRFEYVQPKMGTVFRLLIWAPSQASADAAARAAWARVDELQKCFSDYDPASELNRLSRRTDAGPMPAPVPVSEDLWQILNHSADAYRLSGGAFDVTVGPVTRLQRESRRTGKLPDPERLSRARACVGWQYVKLDPDGHRVQLLHGHMQLDVGGIAKGYTSDQVLKLLRERGMSRALCGAAGDITTADAPPGRDYWTIAIQSLKSPDQTADYVRLRDGAVSTSGDTYRSAEADGKRFSHIIDPQTGLGLTERIGVTTVAPKGVTADWAATAISILGPQKGIAMIERIPGAAARVVTLDSAGREHLFESRSLAAFLMPHPPTTAPTTRPVN